MNYSYTFKYRRRLLWKKHSVIGHQFDDKQNKVVLFFEDGGILEIKDWNKCVVRLDKDWVLAIKRAQEDKIGQSIKMAVKE